MLLSDATAPLFLAPLLFAILCEINFVMFESGVTQGQYFMPPAATAGGQVIVRPFAERGPVRAPAATYLSQQKHESQATSVSIGFEDPSKPRSGSHDPEKEPFEQQHIHSSHHLPFNHSRVTNALDNEDEGDDNGPKQHAIWILVGAIAAQLW